MVVVGLLAWATYAVFPASFAAGIAFLTAVIVFLIHGVAPDTAAVAFDRGLDSVIGGALGLMAYALWPTWSGGSAGRVMAELVDAQRAYVLAVLELVVTGTDPVDAQLRPLARRARIAWSNADAVITLAQAEPARRLGDTGMRAIASLGGLRRLVYAGHTVRLEITELEGRTARPAWAPFRAALDEALSLIARRLRDATATAPLPDLRTLLRAAHAVAPLHESLLGPLGRDRRCHRYGRGLARSAGAGLRSGASDGRRLHRRPPGQHRRAATNVDPEGGSDVRGITEGPPGGDPRHRRRRASRARAAAGRDPRRRW